MRLQEGFENALPSWNTRDAQVSDMKTLQCFFLFTGFQTDRINKCVMSGRAIRDIVGRGTFDWFMSYNPDYAFHVISLLVVSNAFCMWMLSVWKESPLIQNL